MDVSRTEDLAGRLGAVEQRLDRLERQACGTGTDMPSAAHEPGPSQAFWVLDGLRARLSPGAGAVVLAGVVPLPTGEQYAWQHGQTAEGMLGASWIELSKAIAALGHPVRLRLLQLILTGTRSAADLQSLGELGTTGQLYHHLRQLMAAGWLVQTTRGHYSVPGNRVIPLLALLLAAEH
jgi:hypothetical protein